MRLNTLAPAAGSKPSKKRVGRGIGSGLGKNWWPWSQRSKITLGR